MRRSEITYQIKYACQNKHFFPIVVSNVRQSVHTCPNFTDTLVAADKESFLISALAWHRGGDKASVKSVIIKTLDPPHFLSMMTSSNGNIFRVTGHLCGEFTGPRWIPHTKASDAELWCFLWSASEKNDWVNNREAGDLKRYRAHYDVTVMHL